TDGSGLVTITGGALTGNTTANQGAAVWLDGGNAPLTMTNVLVAANTAFAGATGALGNAGSGAVTITDCVVRDNFSGSTGGGGGIEDAAPVVVLTSDTLDCNLAAVDGFRPGNAGGLNVEPGAGDATVAAFLFTNNAGVNAGGIFAQGGALTVRDSQFTGIFG